MELKTYKMGMKDFSDWKIAEPIISAKNIFDTL